MNLGKFVTKLKRFGEFVTKLKKLGKICDKTEKIVTKLRKFVTELEKFWEIWDKTDEFTLQLTLTSSSSLRTLMFVSFAVHDFSSINAFTRFINDSSRIRPASRTSLIKSVTTPG
jgi:ribosomal protein S18